MPEIWENPFANAHLKVERANKHIAEIEERIRVSSYDNGPRMHMDGKTGEKYIYCAHTDWELAADLALIVGDAIHNLHSAIDIAYRETIRVFSPAGFHPTKTKFIVANDRNHLETSLADTAKVSRDSPVFDLIVNGVKPYKRGDGDVDICAIHALDIDDKHHLIIPLVTVARVSGIELEHEDGRIEVLDIVLTRRQSFRQNVPLETQLKNHGQVTFRVTFREATGFNDVEVIPTLRRFSAKTLKLVRILQRMALNAR